MLQESIFARHKEMASYTDLTTEALSVHMVGTPGCCQRPQRWTETVPHLFPVPPSIALIWMRIQGSGLFRHSC